MPDPNHHARFSQFNNFNIHFCVKTVSQRQFLYNAVKRWNDLPPALKEPVSLPTFKRKISFKKVISLKCEELFMYAI